MGRAGGGHGGHRWARGEAYRAPGLRPSRRLRDGSAANIFGSSSVAARETCGTARESSRCLRSPLPPRASQTGLRGCPALPGRGSGGAARRDPHGRGTAAAAGPAPPRGAPRRRRRDGAARDGTGRAGGDPAAGPAGLGGLGRPLPLQPSEMAEHVAIMPRHSGCPARPALISGPRTPLLSPCAPRKGNKTQHVSSAPAHKAPGLGLSGGQSGPSISAPGPLCPSPPCHTFCSRIQ